MTHHCRDCQRWMVVEDDPVVGLCRVHQEWRGQFEGEDLAGECQYFAVRIGAPEVTEIECKVHVFRVAPGGNKAVMEANRDRLFAWKREGKSYYWMSQKIGISERSSSSLSAWFRAQVTE